MEANWDAITSISTLFLTLFTLGLMIATFWLAVIALQAKNTWKEELKEKKKLDLLRKIKSQLNDLSEHLLNVVFYANIAVKGFEEVDEYLKTLHNLLKELLNTQQELIYIKYEVFSDMLLSIIYKGNNSPFFKRETNNANIIISDNMQERQTNEVNELLANVGEIRELINKSEAICDEEIKKFYTK